MGAEFELVSEDVAYHEVARSLGFATLPSTTDLLFELLRAITCALTNGNRPVHVVRLINRVMSIAAVLVDTDSDERTLRDRLHQDLGALLDAGDLVELGGGLWLPAPSRLVSLEASGSYLLVGGIPTRLVAEHGAGNIERHGPFRRLSHTSGLSQFEFTIETVDSWARLPAEALTEWAADLLTVSLTPYIEPKDGTPLQIYAPELAKRRVPQFKRWRDNPQGCNGRYLARRTRVFGSREYRLVDVSRGRVERIGALLASGESRRFMYAADSLATNPVVVTWSQNAGMAEFVAQSELPRAEQRVFAALGTLAIDPDRVYERRWRFNTHVELVLERLGGLDIDVQDLSDRRPR